MADRENSNLGEEIQDIVQNAVSTMDFQKLNSEISTTVNAALSEVRQALGIVPVGKNELQGPKPGTWKPVGSQRTEEDSKRWPPLEETASYPSAAIPERRGPSALPPGQRRTGMPQEGIPNRAGRPVQGGGAGRMAESRRIPSGNQGSYQTNSTQRRAAERYSENRQAAGAQGGQPGQPGQPGRPGWGFAGRGQAGTQEKSAESKSWKQTAADIVNTQKSRLDAANSRRFEGRMVDRSRQGRSGVPIPYVPVGNISGTLLTVFGSLGSAFCGITSLVMFILLCALGEDVFAAVLAGMLPALIVSIIVARRGSKIRKRLRRMKSYMKVLQVRGFSSVKELANATGVTEKFVRKDLRKMLSLGMFPEGQMDDTLTCFMATRKSSEQYRIAQSGYERREAEEKARQAEAKRKEARQAKALAGEAETEREESVSDGPDALSPEVKEAVENGREYMRQIRETNDAIPDEEVSEQLNRLELIIDRIFYHVEKHPEQLSEIRKFMDYYLPTTLKLLKAYQEFDSQPVQGENIKTAKQEIRNTLNTINIAFENLLDSLFEDAAMDVSTDISVLQTMLKQEGLTGSEFEQASRESAD